MSANTEHNKEKLMESLDVIKGQIHNVNYFLKTIHSVLIIATCNTGRTTGKMRKLENCKETKQCVPHCLEYHLEEFLQTH